MRILVALFALLVIGCGARFQRAAARAGELIRAQGVDYVSDKVCDAAADTYSFDGGEFEIPRSSCIHRQLPDGNLQFSFTGTGKFRQHVVFSGEFSESVVTTYAVCLNSGYLYLMPRGTYAAPPTFEKQSFMSRIAESWDHRISMTIREKVSEKVDMPRTVIMNLRGQRCVVPGWISPGSVPTKCSGERPGEEIAVAGGTAEPSPSVPADWAGTCGGSGFDVTAVAAPSKAKRKANASSWNARAEKAMKVTLKKHGDQIASDALSITHPTGKDATLSRHGIDANTPGTLTVWLEVAWRGGIVGRQYVTTITWVVDENGHRSAAVTNDSAVIKAGGVTELNEYFRALHEDR